MREVVDSPPLQVFNRGLDMMILYSVDQTYGIKINDPSDVSNYLLF